MRPHYSEADLLETYYMQPGESMPVMMHLADCEPCAERYERLEGKLRSLAVPPEMPETFWTRQQHAIAARLAAEGEVAARIVRFAAAAVLAAVIAGTLVFPLAFPQQEATPVVEDPWESEELRELQPLVEWESWIESGGTL